MPGYIVHAAFPIRLGLRVRFPPKQDGLSPCDAGHWPLSSTWAFGALFPHQQGVATSRTASPPVSPRPVALHDWQRVGPSSSPGGGGGRQGEFIYGVPTANGPLWGR